MASEFQHFWSERPDRQNLPVDLRGYLAGVTDSDEVEWLAGPGGPSEYPAPDEWVETQLLGEVTDLERYRGVLAGDGGPWSTAVHVARVTGDDHVIAAGVHRRPVGTVDGGMAAVEGSGWGMLTAGDGAEAASVLEHGRAFTAAAAADLEIVHEGL